MTRPALLDNVTHRHLRLHTGRSAALGDARQSALALPAEFRQLQAHFPIIFQHIGGQDGSGGFQPIALFGLEEGQNLFLSDAGWDAPVVPMALQRDPFMIGRNGDSLQLHIDMDSPRIVRPEEGEVGTAVFLPHGGHSEYLDHVVSLLEHLHAHAQHLPAFIEALTRHQLLEPFVFDVESADCEQTRLSGLFTIHEERLAALPGDALERLQREGHLLPIYMQLASLAHFHDLVERQNRTQ
ncbi:SapC family protein [Roseateles saccharophilus]|uniref:SapC protein n=1 Tax=Roseateles saccharophilus TaxID=304 RepID=A0A4R3UU89_ROSSA|nr:SapC family protein [Roseateles saccharophilus]MDG0833211.1 peptidase [Roseateles saccharophilus]TCU94440.1 SapC protein [Roseateles saccharophilus]